jgi:hypothetical protein
MLFGLHGSLSNDAWHVGVVDVVQINAWHVINT